MPTNNPESDYNAHAEVSDSYEAAIQGAKSSGGTVVAMIEDALEMLTALEEEISRDLDGPDATKLDVFDDEREALQSALNGLTYWYKSANYNHAKELANHGN